jgi:DNA polymerase III delta prime subunit
VSGGDLRKAITFLQSASDLYNRRVTPANIVEISGVFPDKLLADTVKVIKEGNFESVCSGGLEEEDKISVQLCS